MKCQQSTLAEPCMAASSAGTAHQFIRKISPGVGQVTQPHIFESTNNCDCDSIPSQTKLKPPCPAAVAL